MDQSVYPILLTNLCAVQAVVVGGGTVAQRKVRGLLAAHANVHVISPALTAELADLHSRQEIIWSRRMYAYGDLVGAGLVVAATDSRAVNGAVAQEAHSRKILCNVVDAPHEGSFHVPAVYRDEETVIAVSTGGTDPRRAVRLRDWIAGLLAEK